MKVFLVCSYCFVICRMTAAAFACPKGKLVFCCNKRFSFLQEDTRSPMISWSSSRVANILLTMTILRLIFTFGRGSENVSVCIETPQRRASCLLKEKQLPFVSHPQSSCPSSPFLYTAVSVSSELLFCCIVLLG